MRSARFMLVALATFGILLAASAGGQQPPGRGSAAPSAAKTN